MSLGSTTRRSLAAMILLFAGAAPPSAWAQETSEATAAAQALFLEARKLVDAGRIPEACRKFEESMRLEPADGTLLNMASCHEKEGRLATAWAEFNDALTAARRSARTDREKLARDHIAAIEPLLTRITLVLPSGPPPQGLQVRVNGVVLGAAAWSSAIPVDPGKVVIEATAPGRVAWRTTLQVTTGGSQSVSIPELALAPARAPAPAGPPSSASAMIPPTEPPTAPASFWNTRRTVGVVLGGAGVAVIGIGTFFGIRALGRRADSDAWCSGSTCTDQRGVDLNDQARTDARISDLTIGIGAAMTVSGILLLALGGDSASSAPASAKSSVTLSVRPSLTGARLEGSW